MAKNDVKIVKMGGAQEATFLTAAGTSLVVGDAVKKNGDYVIRVADSDPTIGTDVFMGVVSEASTDTASAAGTVKVIMPAPDTILRCKATTSTNVNTQAKIDALKMHSLYFEITTGTTIRVDEDGSDTPGTMGLFIIGGDPKKYTLDFYIDKEAGPAGY